MTRFEAEALAAKGCTVWMQTLQDKAVQYTDHILKILNDEYYRYDPWVGEVIRGVVLARHAEGTLATYDDLTAIRPAVWEAVRIVVISRAKAEEAKVGASGAYTVIQATDKSLQDRFSTLDLYTEEEIMADAFTDEAM